MFKNSNLAEIFTNFAESHEDKFNSVEFMEFVFSMSAIFMSVMSITGLTGGGLVYIT